MSIFLARSPLFFPFFCFPLIPGPFCCSNSPLLLRHFVVFFILSSPFLFSLSFYFEVLYLDYLMSRRRLVINVICLK